MASPKTKWSCKLRVVLNPALDGDRINLPGNALTPLIAEDSTSDNILLTFQLVNHAAQTKAFSSVREFTAPEGCVEVGPLLSKGLHLREPSDAAYLTVTLAELPKGIFVKLAPLSADYVDIQDIKATLESHLRAHYHTLTEGEILSVTVMSTVTRRPKNQEFLVAEIHVEGSQKVPGCLIVNQDIAVDIQPLDAEIAEEAVRRKYATKNTGAASLVWDEHARLALCKGTVNKGDDLFFRVPTLPDVRQYRLRLEKYQGDANLYVSTHVERPTIRDHDYYNVEMGSSVVSLQMEEPTRPFIFVGIHGYVKQTDFELSVDIPALPASATISSESTKQPEEAEEGTVICVNCGASVRQQVSEMHLAFCQRNNAICPDCKKVMSKADFADHWHCALCNKNGHIGECDKHMELLHTPVICECRVQVFLPEISHHRATVCSERLHICRFCHLLVKAGRPSFNAKDILLGGLSSHESACGARTTTCVKCASAVMLKEVATHAKLHEHQKRFQKIFEQCTNRCCANPQPQSEQFRNYARLCQHCYAPFWSPRDDPGNQKFAQKLVALYHQQLTKGCGKDICENMYCATGSKSAMDSTDAAIKALDLLKSSVIGSANPQYWLCSIVDIKVYARRKKAENLT